MAVVSVKEDPRAKRSGYRDGKESHSRRYVVKCSNRDDGTITALFAVGIPAYGDSYSVARANVKCVSKDAQPIDDSTTIFEVTVQYETIDSKRKDQSPLSRPPEVHIGHQETTVDYFVDVTDKPVTTVIGEPFKQSPKRFEAHRVISYVRNEAADTSAGDDTYANATNAAAVSINSVTYGADTLLCKPIDSEKVIEVWNSTEITYYRKAYTFWFKGGGWLDEVGHVGTKTGLGKICDKEGTVVTTPWPLNADGTKKTNQSDPIDMLQFQPYESVSWTALGLT